nr:histidine kinase N-terminal 7TM domain-containing protein [Bacillus suaedae]
MCTSGVLNLYLCCRVLMKRHHYSTIANFFVIYAVSVTIYCFAAAFGLAATTLEQMKLSTIIQYIGLPFSAPLGLLFIMKYLGITIKKKTYLALFTIPIISLIMVVTNDYHHLHYRVFEVDPNLGAPFIYMEIGIWYMIYGSFTFACMFVAFLLVLSRWGETDRAYRTQLIALIFGQLVPMLTAFVYLIGLTPPGIDPVPMILWVSSLLYLWSINSSQLFKIMPIAKDAIFNSINDGVIVLDESDRVIEFNNACEQMFPLLTRSLFGKGFDDVWLSLAGRAFPFPLSHVAFKSEIELVVNNSKRVYQIRTSALEPVTNGKGMLLIFTDITEVNRLQKKLEQQAYYDELTEIFNRRAFFTHCEEEIAAAREASNPFTIILLDIDYFRKVNDTYGHYIGDRLLVHVAKVCQAELTEGMLFARYGGEEFVLALSGRTIEEGQIIANKLRRKIQEQPLLIAEGIISVTFSSGVAEAMKTNEETLHQLLNKADQALYAAKRDGRNRVHIYTENLL